MEDHGDLGEILVEQDYDLELFDGVEKHHDGITPDGKKVQLKTTMKNLLTFPCDHTPAFCLGIKIFFDGTYEKVFNTREPARRRAGGGITESDHGMQRADFCDFMMRELRPLKSAGRIKMHGLDTGIKSGLNIIQEITDDNCFLPGSIPVIKQ